MSGKIFDLTPESEGPRRAMRRPASYGESSVVGDTYLARALEQAALDALRGAEWVVRRRAAAGQAGGEDAVTLALARPRREFDTAEWERTVRRVAADRAVGMAYLARKREERLARRAAEVAEGGVSLPAAPMGEAGVLQARAEVGREGGALSPALSGRIQAKRGGGQPLEATVRRGMEGVFGVDFSPVRIHADPEADALNRGVAAIAFTVGSDIFFRAGFYQPQTPAGQHLLAHELTHVVQQRTGSLGTSGGGGASGGTMTVGAADDRHEQEAEATAYRVIAALQIRGQALTAPATSPGAALSRAHAPKMALSPSAPGVARVSSATVRRFGLGDLWQAVTGAASAAWGGFTGALRGIAQAGYNAVTGTLHWAQAVVTGAGQLAGQAVTVVANAAHNATQFAVTVGGKVVGLVSQATAQAIGQVMQTVAAARTALAAVTSMAAFLARKLHDAPAAFVQALQDKAHQVLMGVLGPDVSAILGGAASTLALILKDPLTFLNNLGLALKAGFGMVSQNLKGVLQGGLMSWLSGSLGVTIPDGAVKFDGAGIITLGLNALHLGYDALKAGVIAGLTKQGVKDAATVVSRLETGALAGFTLLQTIRTKGLAGAWDALTQQVGDSLGSALDGAKAAVMQWVTQHVIQGVIAQLVALCTPVGDIVELLLTIYKAVQFFLDKMRALGQFMATLKDAVTRVATGDVWHAGAQIYNAVVASVPLLLGFVANLLGLGDVGAAMRNALAALTAPVRRIEAKLIALIVSKGQAFAASLHGPSKGSAAPPGQHGGNPKHEAIAQQIIATLVKISGAPKDFATTRAEKVQQASAITPGYQRQLEHGINLSITFATKPDDAGGKETLDVTVLIAPNDTKKSARIPVEKIDPSVDDAQAGTRAHPFPIIWPKPASRDYPTLYFGGPSKAYISQADLKKSVGKQDATGTIIKEYKPESRATLSDGKTEIGLIKDWYVEPGITVVGPASNATTRGGYKLTNQLKKFGFSPAREGMDGDHVHEIQMGGADNIVNLWPLDSNPNRAAGNIVNAIVVHYPSGKTTTVEELKKTASTRKYFFRVVECKP